MGLLNQTQQQYYSTSPPNVFGDYQFADLADVIDAFMVIYVGEDKLIPKARRFDVAFHAQRAMQELSFDTFKSIKSQEIVIPNSLTMILPQDYVNYVKLTWCDSAGIEHIIYPAIKTSNPLDVTQDDDGNYTFTSSNLDTDNSSTTWDNYKSTTPSENNTDDYDDDTFWPNMGKRYGLDPAHSQVNGSFFIDENTGKIHFSSNISGKTVILKYISDSLGTDGEMQVHKMAQEALYKSILYGVLSAQRNVDPNRLVLIKKEKFAETRKAKIRLSNIKLEEITQILRGKSKQIKH